MRDPKLNTTMTYISLILFTLIALWLLKGVIASSEVQWLHTATK